MRDRLLTVYGETLRKNSDEKFAILDEIDADNPELAKQLRRIFM